MVILFNLIIATFIIRSSRDYKSFKMRQVWNANILKEKNLYTYNASTIKNNQQEERQMVHLQ